LSGAFAVADRPTEAAAGRSARRLAPGAVRLAPSAAPALVAWYTVAGPEEATGPLGHAFDEHVPDYAWGESSFERTERKLLRHATQGVLGRAGWAPDEVDLHLGGDLLDEITTHNFVARELGIPFVGMFSACATGGGALSMGALAVAAGAAERVLCSVSSHYYTAERQYRYPVELGVERLATNQRTATGAVAFLLGPPPAGGGEAIRVTAVTWGRVRDLGVKDPNNMGAAEGPAAADTLLRHFSRPDAAPEDYDLVLTGDLARVGLPLARRLCREGGLDLGERWQDAGVLLYAPDQPVQAGGSGAACCALVLAGHVLAAMARGELGRVLFVATGSLHSKTTYQQGDVLPVVAHAVELEGPAARPRRGGEEA
jgi:stage V sporulation protein AD